MTDYSSQEALLLVTIKAPRGCVMLKSGLFKECEMCLHLRDTAGLVPDPPPQEREFHKKTLVTWTFVVVVSQGI